MQGIHVAGRCLNLVAGLLAAVIPCMSAHAAALHFDQAEYMVDVGGTFEVRVLLDMDDSTPGDQVPASGLFSAGSQVTFSASGLSVGGPADIVLPEELDGNGLGGPPTKVAAPGRAGGAGVISFLAETGYPHPTVLTVTLTADAPGLFTLTPGLLNSPPLANFLDFEGTLLDPQITNFPASVVSVGGGVRFVGMEQASAGALRLLFEYGGGGDALYLERLNPLSSLPEWEADGAAVIGEAGGGLWEAVTGARFDRGVIFRMRIGAAPAAPRWVEIDRPGSGQVAMVFEYLGLPADFVLERQETGVCCPSGWEPVPGAVFTPVATHRYRVAISEGPGRGLRYRVRATPN